MMRKAFIHWSAVFPFVAYPLLSVYLHSELWTSFFGGVIIGYGWVTWRAWKCA